MQPTVPAAGRQAPRVGNLGHLTRISNKLVQLGNSDNRIQARLQVCEYSGQLMFLRLLDSRVLVIFLQQSYSLGQIFNGI